MTKKKILIVSTVYIVYFLLLLLLGVVCDSKVCEIHENGFFVTMLYFLAPFLFVFIFSLLTYWKEDSVFRAWWNPARFWIVTIIIATIVTTIIDESRVGSSIGDFPMSVPVLGLLYTLFVVTSLVNIVKAYRR